MTTEIKRRVVLISFNTKGERFDSLSKRNQFFRKLYGWRQVVSKKGKNYHYEREGLLSQMPHIKVEDSVFMVAENNLKEVEDYFNNWKSVVDYKIMKMMLLEKKLLEELEKMEREFEE